MAEEVSAARAAQLSGLSERTIRRRIASGQLAARRISTNRFAIRVEDLSLRSGVATVAARLDALDARLRGLEEAVAALGTTLSMLAGNTVTDGQAEARMAEQVRALMAQLEQETTRLAPVLGYGMRDDQASDSAILAQPEGSGRVAGGRERRQREHESRRAAH